MTDMVSPQAQGVATPGLCSPSRPAKPMTRYTMRRAATVIALLLQLAAGARAGDWPMFRGPDGNGISAEKGLPLEWGPDRNVRWNVPLPAPGNSCPVVSGDRVF